MCCRPAPISSVLQLGYFSGFRTWSVNQTLGVPFSSPCSPSYHFIPHSFSSSPLEVGPLNPARRLGSTVSSPSRVYRRKLNLVHFSLKIWRLVATNLKIFLRIKWSNFMPNFQILRRIWQHVNSAKHWIAIASKTVTRQYGATTVFHCFTACECSVRSAVKVFDVHAALGGVMKHWQLGDVVAKLEECPEY